MHQVTTLQCSGAGFYDAQANNGLGEYKAYFIVVKDGHENEAQDRARAFASAGVKGGLRVRDGVIAMSRKQIEQRMTQLREKLAQAGVEV